MYLVTTKKHTFWGNLRKTSLIVLKVKININRLNQNFYFMHNIIRFFYLDFEKRHVFVKCTRRLLTNWTKFLELLSLNNVFYFIVLVWFPSETSVLNGALLKVLIGLKAIWKHTTLGAAPFRWMFSLL